MRVSTYIADLVASTMRLRFTLLPLGLVALLPTIALGLGFEVPDQDAAATARGNAFTATADNASAIFYNPAGITQTDGFSIRTGVYGVSIDEDYKPLHDNTGAHDSTAHEPVQPVPTIYMDYHPKGAPYAFGLGVYAPFGLKTEWPDDASFRQAGLYGSLQNISINPVLAIQVTRSLSVAVGISANYANAQLREGLTAMPGDSFSFKGESWAIGGNAGLLWKPTERQAIGLSYHTQVDEDLTGHTQEELNGTERGESERGNAELAAGKAQLNAAIAQINGITFLPPSVKRQLIATATAQYDAAVAASGVPAGGRFPTSYPTLAGRGLLTIPQYAVLGYSFRPTPDWNIEADIEWTDWDSLNTLALHRPGGSTVNVPFDFVHSFNYELGVTHEMWGYKFSAGYMYTENSSPAATFSPLIPDSARNVFSVGIGKTFGNFGVDLAYQLAVGVPRTLVNDSVADGRYSFLSNAVSISLGYHF